MNRIIVVGSTGVGKTTLARQMARLLDLTHIEMDSLYWGPGWVERPKELVREEVLRRTAVDGWVVDGNYSFARDIIWPQADTAVWLDYPLALILWRLFKRTIRRTISREELWNGNRENFRNQFWSRDSLFLYALKSRRKHHHIYPQLFASPEYAHIQLFRHFNTAETERFLKTLKG